MDALPALVAPKEHRSHGKIQRALPPREMESRCEIYLERYVKDVAVESRLTWEIAKTTIFPAAIKYQRELASTALALKQLGKSPCTAVLDELSDLVQELEKAINNPWPAALGSHVEGSTLDHAKACARPPRSCDGKSARSGR